MYFLASIINEKLSVVNFYNKKLYPGEEIKKEFEERGCA